MNWLRSWIFTSTAYLITLNFCATASFAQMNTAELSPGSEMGCPIECAPWPEKLELSDEQMEKLISLKSEFEIRNAEKKAQIMANMKQIALYLTDEKSDKNVILTLNEKNNALKAELAVARVNKMIEAMAIMTAKQKAQIHHNVLVHTLSPHQTGDMYHHGWKKHH